MAVTDRSLQPTSLAISACHAFRFGAMLKTDVVYLAEPIRRAASGTCPVGPWRVRRARLALQPAGRSVRGAAPAPANLQAYATRPCAASFPAPQPWTALMPCQRWGGVHAAMQRDSSTRSSHLPQTCSGHEHCVSLLSLANGDILCTCPHPRDHGPAERHGQHHRCRASDGEDR